MTCRAPTEGEVGVKPARRPTSLTIAIISKFDGPIQDLHFLGWVNTLIPTSGKTAIFPMWSAKIWPQIPIGKSVIPKSLGKGRDFFHLV